MEYDEMLPHYYNNNQRFLQKRLDKKVIRDSKIFEKAEIKWFSFDDIKKQHNEFRSFYKNIIHLILGHRSAIEGFIKSKLYSDRKSLEKSKKNNSRSFRIGKRNYKKINYKKRTYKNRK